MLAVRRLAAQDIPAVAAIVVALPDYFTDQVAGHVERDCARHDAWVLTDSDEVAGFAAAQRTSAGGAEILWMAVASGRRGRGIEVEFAAADAFHLERLGRRFETVLDCGLFHRV
jgi:ribosomal protein S18 acetylase RimI-like enzyme